MESVRFIEVDAGVRYWEDATVNGVDDEDGSLIPFKRQDAWCPVIRLADGLVMDWPLGVVADVYYKVCDAGLYWLLDEDQNRIAKWAGFYVPEDFLCHGDNGYGDYIILKIDAEGFIKNWKFPEIEMLCGCDEDNQQGWKEVLA